MLRDRSVLFVHLQGFYAQVLAPDPAQLTVIHREKRIIDANPEAIARGVEIGMGLAEVKAMFGREAVCVAWQEEPYRAAQAGWLDVCCIHSDVIEPTDQHEAFVDLSGHSDPYGVRRALVRDLRKHTGLAVRTGLAPCRWLAQAACGLKTTLPTEDPEAFAALQPVHVMPIPQGYDRRLFLLGCRSVGDVALMSIDSLRQQFGNDAHLIHQLSEGKGEARVDALYPPDSVSDRFSFEGAATELEVFDNGLKELARVVGTRLSEKEVFGKTLELWIETEDAKVEYRSRAFSKPLASHASVLVALRLLCGAPEVPVTRLRMRIPKLEKGNRVQRTLDNVCAQTARQTASKVALANVKSAFGDDAILTGAEIKEPRWKLVRKAWRTAYGWSWR